MNFFAPNQSFEASTLSGDALKFLFTNLQSASLFLKLTFWGQKVEKRRANIFWVKIFQINF